MSSEHTFTIIRRTALRQRHPPFGRIKPQNRDYRFAAGIPAYREV